MNRACSDCGCSITAKNRSGRCRPCCVRRFSTDPALNEKRRERLAAKVQDEGYKARHRAGSKRGAANRVANPLHLARLQEIGRTYGLANLALGQSEEARQKIGDTLRRRHLAWCPEEYWPMNQLLKRAGYRLPERKEMIAAEVARAKKAATPQAAVKQAEPLTFEQQMERVRNGAKLTTVPDTRPTGPAYSLVGNATGML